MEKKKSLEEEIQFLSLLGLTYVPFNNGEYPGMIFEGDELVGYIVLDDAGDLLTQIDGYTMKGSYSCERWDSGLTIRRFTLIKDEKEYQMFNIHSDDSDYIDYDIPPKETCGIKFEKNKIYCGKSNIYQNIEENGKWFKGVDGVVNSTIERFRGICPELIDSYISKYISEPKKYQKK